MNYHVANVCEQAPWAMQNVTFLQILLLKQFSGDRQSVQ
jgi:hypothetical protein